MAKYIIKRVLIAIVTLLVIIIVLFLLLKLAEYSVNHVKAGDANAVL